MKHVRQTVYAVLIIYACNKIIIKKRFVHPLLNWSGVGSSDCHLCHNDLSIDFFRAVIIFNMHDYERNNLIVKMLQVGFFNVKNMDSNLPVLKYNAFRVILNAH